jgi:hypothetical protein
LDANKQANGKYVYCIIKCPEEPISFGTIGFDGGEVYTIAYRNFAPVVSDAPVKEYAANEEEVEVHKTIVSEVMKEHSVLPVAYGMVFKNKKLLSVAMNAGNKAMKKALQAVDNKVELGVKVILPKDITSWNGSISQCKNDFKETLNEIASDFKDLKLFSDRLLLNSAFLVEKDSMDHFSDAVGQLVAQYGDLRTQYSGPWPPYNFVDIHILGKKRKGFR